MKHFLSKNFLLGAFAALAIAFSGCEKDEGKLPDIAFKTGAGYTPADATLAPGATVLVGITADKTEDKDVLKTFTMSVSYDGGAEIDAFTQTLTGDEGDHFETDIPIALRNVTGTEKYTFTVVNRDGLTNSVSLTVTTQ
ncbi:MAG: hypothetical protein R2791_19335 [Saprospiraceae bacterium]